MMNSKIQKIIIDTDLGNDIDDVLAIAFLHKLHIRKHLEIIGITSSNANTKSVNFLNFLNLYYGNDIPTGIIKRNGKLNKKEKYLHILPILRELYPEISDKLKNEEKIEDATQCVISALESCTDNSVILLMIGFATNIANLLTLEIHREVVHKKVHKIICMAGHFPFGPKEYNIFSDQNSFQKLLDLWNKEIEFIGFELGKFLLFSSSDIAYLEELNQDYPVTLAFRSYKKYQYNQPGWDPIAAIYCSFPHLQCFEHSESGRLIVDPVDCSTSFIRDKVGKHTYLKIRDTDEKKLKNIFLQTMFNDHTLSSHKYYNQ